MENSKEYKFLAFEDGDFIMVPYNSSVLYIQYHEKEDCLKVAVPTDDGLTIKYNVPYDHSKSLDMNYQDAFAQYKIHAET